MRRLPLLALAVALACSSEVTPENPYDPATPLDRQAKARVSGRLDAPALASPAGIDVFLRQDGQLVRSFSTDGAGAFVFDALTPGAYAVEAAPQGFLPVTVPLSLQAGEEVDLGTLTLTAMLGNDASYIEGEATLGSFSAGPGAAGSGGILVEAVGTAFTAVTASDGAFRLTVPEGTYTLRISHPDYVAATVPDVQIGRAQTVTILPVVLAANPASIAGHVEAELPDGSAGPLADALVTLDGTSATGLTNAAGDFTLDQLPPGSYLLRVVKAGYASVSVPVLNLDGGELRILAEPLSLSLERGALRGAVALADASDASGVVVEVTGTGRAAVTGADGGFLFDGLVAGVYEVRARRDGYGMQAVGGLAVTAGATRDVPPMTLTRQGGAVAVAEGTVTRNRAITLVLGAPSAASYRASEDPTFADPALGDTTGTHPYGGPGSSVPFTLSDRDGAHDVHVVFLDAQGSASAPSSASVVLDRVAPSAPSVVIGSGAGFTSASTVSLSLTAQDLPGVAGAAVSGLWKMELSSTSDFSGSVLLDYNVATAWPLGAGDGVKAVYARFSDRAGNVSDPAQASVTLDTVPPAAPAIALAGGAGAPPGTTGSPVVTATLSATDANAGVGGRDLQVRLSNDPGFPGAAWQPYAPAVSWLLPPGDGPKTVHAQFMDPAGNPSLPVSAGITLAATAPTQGSITVAGGALATNAQVAPATLSAVGAAELRLYVDGLPATGWLPYTTSTTVDLGATPDEATRRVSVSFRNAAGVEGAGASTTIVFDRSAPAAPTLVVDGGAAYTAATGVALTLTASDGPAAGLVASGLATVEVANDAAFTASSTYPYTTALSWTLAAGADGPRTVWARVRDVAGNVSAAASATLTLDTAGPTAPSIALAGNPEAQPGYTGTAVVTATLSATDPSEGAGKADLQVRLSNDAGFAGASWQPYPATLPWVLPVGDGPKTVHAQFRDPAGNVSLPVSAAITLEATPPTGGSIVLAGGAEATSAQVVSAAISASGAVSMRLSVNGTAVTGWIPYATSTPVDLGAAPDEATRVVTVSFRGAGGVEGAAATDAIRFDRTAPGAGTLAVVGTLGNGTTSGSLTATPAVVLQIGPPGGDEAEMAVTQAATAATPCASAFATPLWQPVSRTATVVVTGADGPKRACVLFRDAAGNASAATAAEANITLDTTPPTNPEITNLASRTQGSTSAPESGLPVVTASSDATAGGVTYQCVGGTGTSYGPQWTDCGTSTTLPFAWTLAANQESTLGVRARDAAYNTSPGSFVRIVHDGVAPFPPFITDIRASRDSVTVTWDATADTDVEDYLVYYGNATADYAGTGAAQGPSPVQVTAVSGQAAPTLTLTNLTPGLPYYLAVEAVDAAGNRSGPGGQRLAVPSRANPRVLSTFGGQPRTMASATAGAKTFLYLAENQGLVQLDVTSDAGVPVVVGRAYLPDLVPDEGGSLAIIACSKGAVAGHCVLPAGTTAEGDYRGNADDYRASVPIVFFKTTGTAAAPVVGTIEGLLPVRPHRVLVGNLGGEQVVVTVDRQSVRAFTFKAGQLAFLRQVAREDVNASVLSIHAATLVGDQLHVYARVDPRDDSAPNLWTFDLADALAGTIVETRHGPLLDDAGFVIGDVRLPGISVQDFVPAFHGGVFLAYVSQASDQSVVSWYSPGFAAPQDTLTLPSGPGSDGVQPVAAAGGLNQNLYVLVSSGMGGAEGFQVLDDGGLTYLSTFSWAGISDAVAAHAGLNHLGQERLWAIETSGFNRSLERYTVSGTTVAHLANAFRELPPEAFAESDRFVYVAAGSSIHTVEAANPYTPTVVRSVTPGWSPNYTKVFTHGRFLYALGGASGLDVFRMNGDGSLTYRTYANDASITDAAVVGRWLVTVSGSGLRAWDATNVGAASPPGSLSVLATLAPGVTVGAIAARYDSSTAGSPGVNPIPRAVIYAVTSAAELRTYTFDGTTLAPIGTASWSGEGGNAVTVKGDYAVAGTPSGSYLFSVSNPAAPFLTGPSIYPLAGPALLQNGYVVGLGAYGEASGPVFAGRSAAGVDGAIRFSACAAPTSGADGSFTHVDGRYAASCGRNGIAFFTPVSVDGGRLLKAHDVTASWSTYGAALASDGMLARLGGPAVPGAGFTDWSRLYTVNEQTTAEGTLSAPFYANTNLAANGPAGAAGSDVLRSAAFMVEADGAIFVVTRKVASAPTVDAFDPGATPWVYLGRYTFVGTAEPAAVATDGEYLYVARNGSAGQVDVVDIRNPLAMSLRASWTSGFFANYTIASLSLSRERLYAGMAQGVAELNEVHVADVSTVQPSGVFTPKTTIQIGVEGGITGVAAVGRTLFYTLHDPVYRVPEYAVGLFRLSLTDRDGAFGAGDTGAASIARLEVGAPAQAPIVAGDVLYVASNLGTASFDLAPYWREGATPAPGGGTNLADPFRTSPVSLRVDGPFASLVGGTYRVFDLR